MEQTYSENFGKVLDLKEDAALKLNFDTRAYGTLTYFIKDEATDIQIDANSMEYADIRILFVNEQKKAAKLNVTLTVHTDSKVQMGLLDLEDSDLDFRLRVHLTDPGATFEIFDGQLCNPKSKKVTDMEVIHEAHNTYGNMHNFAVQFDDSYYEMVANGNIEKGCYQAQSHQETRVLTLGEHHTNKVIPLLLIDEDDVKASHALTIGQPDASQLYYLQSRGLTPKAAMGLLSVGYFMPVINLEPDEKLRDDLRVKMESKVGMYGQRKDHE